MFATRRPHPQGAIRDDLLSQQGAIRDHLLAEPGCTRLNLPPLSSGRYTCARPREVPVHHEIVLQHVGGDGLPVFNVVPWRRRLQYGEQPRELTQSIHVRQHIKIMRFSLADPKSREISTRRLAAFTSSRYLRMIPPSPSGPV